MDAKQEDICWLVGALGLRHAAARIIRREGVVDQGGKHGCADSETRAWLAAARQQGQYVEVAGGWNATPQVTDGQTNGGWNAMAAQR